MHWQDFLSGSSLAISSIAGAQNMVIDLEVFLRKVDML